MTYEVPYVSKESVSLIALGNTGLEPITLRAVMEGFNFRVETHWVGSRQELVKILRGEIATHKHLVLSCHGEADNGGGILVSDEPTLYAPEIGEVTDLPGRNLLNLGCATGSDALAAAFLAGGCAAYIAPVDYVEGNAAIFFALHYFYFLAQKKQPLEAVELSRKHDEQCALFRLFEPSDRPAIEGE